MGLKREKVFVIRKIDFRESDQIVKFFGKESGKFSGIAKGSRKLESKFGSTFDLLNYSEIVYYQGSGLSFISEGEMLDNWEELKKSGLAINTGLRCARTLSDLVIEKQPAPNLFQLFHNTLKGLEEDQRDSRVLELGFYLKALKTQGFEPQFGESCINCGKSLEEESFPFSFDQGGLVCDDCSSGKEIRLSPGDRKNLTRLKNLPQTRVRRLKIPESRLDFYIKLLSRFSEYHLERSVIQVSSDLGGGSKVDLN